MPRRPRPAPHPAPGVAEITRLLGAGNGRVRLVTAAPELPGFGALLREAGRAGAGVSTGHTDADAATLLGAFAAGARSITHAFNGMRPFDHRSPGPLEAIADGGSYCEVICDGLHVHPAMIRILRTLAGPRRIVLVTDAVAWPGLGWAGLGCQMAITLMARTAYRSAMVASASPGQQPSRAVR